MDMVSAEFQTILSKNSITGASTSRHVTDVYITAITVLL